MAKSSTHKDQTLLLIDSHALIHRAYHAFPPTLTNASGELTNAVYGFTTLLLDVLIKFKPSHVIALFDAPGDTVRHDMYAAYKANRSSPDDELVIQIPNIERLLEAFDIPMLRVKGYEADDLIGTIDERHSGEWAKTIIVTGDRDLFQLVDEDTFVYLAGTSFSKSKLFDAEGVKEKMGVGPEYIIDIKSLEGDASDNIPGVAGIGKKGAVTLITEFGHLEEISDRIEELPNRYKKKLSENYEMAVLSKKLATIIKDAPVDFDFEEAPFGTYALDEIKDFFEEMDFYSLVRKLEKLNPPKETAAAAEHAEQQSLFAQQQEAIEEWDKKPVKATEAFFAPIFNKDPDPLGWDIKKLIVNAGGKIFKVRIEDFDSFINSLEVKWVITDDAKALFHVMQNRGLKSSFSTYDLVLATYILSGGQSKQDLASAINWYKLGIAETTVAQLGKIGEVYEKQKADLKADPKLRNLLAMEQKLIPVVVKMERSGINLDVEKINIDHDKLTSEIDKVQQEIFENVGHEFNVSSPKQVGEVLFEERGLPSGRKTKTGSYSTDERTLKELIDADPLVEMVLNYRELTKLLSTYVRPLPGQVNPKTGRIHAEFIQLGAVTGRFASKNPNMQNIPLGEVAGMNIRSAFVASEGSVFVAFDYSQQELRLLAELSGETNMQNAFAEGLDVHALTAAEVFGVKIDEVTKKQRQAGKTINFGIVYGMSAFGFADRLKVDQKEALSFISKYFDEYPMVQKYFDRIIEEADKSGFVETIMGRRRNTSGLKSSNNQVRKATEREIKNFPLQGSAADVIKMAMNNVDEVIGEYPAKMILQVHDELIFEYATDKSISDLVKDPDFKKFVMEIEERMLNVIKLNVPLTVGVEIGKSWGELEEVAIGG